LYQLNQEALETMQQMIALDEGIIPLNFDIKRSLENMTFEEARKTKRKYRKLLKKALKNQGYQVNMIEQSHQRGYLNDKQQQKQLRNLARNGISLSFYLKAVKALQQEQQKE